MLADPRTGNPIAPAAIVGGIIVERSWRGTKLRGGRSQILPNPRRQCFCHRTAHGCRRAHRNPGLVRLNDRLQPHHVAAHRNRPARRIIGNGSITAIWSDTRIWQAEGSAGLWLAVSAAECGSGSAANSSIGTGAMRRGMVSGCGMPAGRGSVFGLTDLALAAGRAPFGSLDFKGRGKWRRRLSLGLCAMRKPHQQHRRSNRKQASHGRASPGQMRHLCGIMAAMAIFLSPACASVSQKAVLEVDCDT